MKTVFLIAGILFFSSTLMARSAPADKEIFAAAKAIEKKIPKVRILRPVKCEISSMKLKAVGLITLDLSKKEPKEGLAAHIFYGTADKAKIVELKEYREGSDMPSTLAIFWDQESKNLKDLEMVCDTPGRKGGNIFDGYEVGSFKKSKEYKTPQICIQTDNMYNNFSCFNFNLKSKKIELSHVQEFAD